ncbi:MAG: hypothetical protein P9L92_00345 [Candidatus Electryonea clarkiae]|nr:hypothetical protein [Candidatus Electryonea clarkiae]MDP8286396.1 hypothetical protein [Candidatus Electryonea clarkiae]
MKTLTGTAARIIYSVPLGIFGIMHFMAGHEMTGMVPAFMPGKIFWVYLTGIALIAATISIITKKHIKLASLLLALMLMIFVLTMHVPGLMNPDMMQMAMVSLLKDISLIGGALIIAGLFGKES